MAKRKDEHPRKGEKRGRQRGKGKGIDRSWLVVSTTPNRLPLTLPLYPSQPSAMEKLNKYSRDIQFDYSYLFMIFYFLFLFFGWSSGCAVSYLSLLFLRKCYKLQGNSFHHCDPIFIFRRKSHSFH